MYLPKENFSQLRQRGRVMTKKRKGNSPNENLMSIFLNLVYRKTHIFINPVVELVVSKKTHGQLVLQIFEKEFSVKLCMKSDCEHCIRTEPKCFP